MIVLSFSFRSDNHKLVFRWSRVLSGENFALLRPATQSSTWTDMVASKAVDGNAVDDTSYTATDDGDFNPWWKVQLANLIWLSHVELTNRQLAGGVCIIYIYGYG